MINANNTTCTALPAQTKNADGLTGIGITIYMLEKVLDVQHPERLHDLYKQSSAGQAGTVFTVTVNNKKETGFYGADDTVPNPPAPNTLEAVIYETQSVVNGSTVKLRLLNDITIHGTLVPKDNFVFGLASLAGERLSITVSNIRYQNYLFPVALSVYDMDGMDGICVPGAITREVAKQSADNALQAVALNSLDPSIGAQAASAGITTAKTLISKKVKLVRVTVKAGYRVLLSGRNNK